MSAFRINLKNLPVAAGNKQASSQIVAWYPNGQMFSGFGFSCRQALEKAAASAWAYI